jgi:ferredoxin-NADP reductase
VPTVTVPLVSVAPVTPRSRLITLDLQDQPFEFRPGQAVLIGAAGHHPRRPYSIASSPERTTETQALELLIALEADGGLGSHLAGVRPGSAVDLEGPLGSFLFPLDDPPQRRLLFVAGGTGIAPLRAMIDHVLRHRPIRHLSLLYSARNGDEFAFIDELRGHATEGHLELLQTVTRDDSSTWAGNRGRIGRAHFQSVVHDPADTLCFVCGPKALVSESVTTLAALGVPAGAIRTESWVVPRA